MEKSPLECLPLKWNTHVHVSVFYNPVHLKKGARSPSPGGLVKLYMAKENIVGNEKILLARTWASNSLHRPRHKHALLETFIGGYAQTQNTHTPTHTHTQTQTHKINHWTLCRYLHMTGFFKAMYLLILQIMFLIVSYISVWWAIPFIRWSQGPLCKQITGQANRVVTMPVQKSRSHSQDYITSSILKLLNDSNQEVTSGREYNYSLLFMV